MKRILCLAVVVLCLGITATSCKKDKKWEPTIENLGDGIYSINGHRFVDLGLPSGLLWAENNVGAASATDLGGLFAWGETSTKTEYTAETYKWGKDEKSLTKYCDKDGKKTLEAADDAATAALKKPCRTPLKAEFAELLNRTNTTCEWTSKTVDNTVVYGLEVKSNTNSNSIFLPANKYADAKQGDYWTAEMYESTPIMYDVAYFYQISEAAGTNGGGSLNKWEGNTVRPVASLKK